MNPATLISLFTAASSLISDLEPQIAALLAKGEITPEQQQAIMDAANRVRNAAFDGPEWQVPDRST